MIVLNVVVSCPYSCTCQQRRMWRQRWRRRLEQAVTDRPSAGSCLIPACSELISSTARWATQMVAGATTIALSPSHLLPTRRRRWWWWWRWWCGVGRGSMEDRGRHKVIHTELRSQWGLGGRDFLFSNSYENKAWDLSMMGGGFDRGILGEFWSIRKE